MSKTIKLKTEPKPQKVKTTYDEKSPITGNFTVMSEVIVHDDLDEGAIAMGLPKEDIYKICMETGYQTYWDSWKESNTEFIKTLEAQMPAWMPAYKYVDSYKRLWYPMLAVSYVATLHPYPETETQLGWAVSNISPAQDESELQTSQIIKMPIQTEEGVKLAYYKVESDTTKYWKFDEFESAFDYYHSIVTESENLNNEHAETSVSVD
jgi:hypothetical protein